VDEDEELPEEHAESVIARERAAMLGMSFFVRVKTFIYFPLSLVRQLHIPGDFTRY